jgi:hypothetical protein
MRFQISVVAMMMEGMSTAETTVTFYETARRNIVEDSENLKSHLFTRVCVCVCVCVSLNMEEGKLL